MHRTLVLIIITIGAFWSTGAAAWGDSGHRTVCEIALRNLTPAADAEVRRLLGAHPVIPVAAPRNKELGWACTYPDNIVAGGPGRRSKDHYVNYARSLGTVTASLGCGAEARCVLKGISDDFLRLTSTASSDKDRAEALMYLGHWIGDIHQPLHSSFSDDEGGNDVNARTLCSGGLHSTWDTCILTAKHYPGTTRESPPSDANVKLLAAAWSSLVIDADRAMWLSSFPWQWSAEGYSIAIRPEIGYCIMGAGGCRYDTARLRFVAGPGVQRRSVPVDLAYMNMAMPIIQRRIMQGGVRLAHVLNLALDPAYRSPVI